jgi:hypothetical protein
VISGGYSALDATTTLDSILVNGTSVFSTNINSTNLAATFSLTETLTAGSTIDFTVNSCSGLDQTYNSDSTGLTGTINPASTIPTPEPSSILLLAFGATPLLLPWIRRRLV